MTYQYSKTADGKLINNRLRYVHDQVANNSYAEDIKSQTALNLSQVQNEKQPELNTDNYRYDKIGNLIEDKAEGITSIEWNVYGKIEEILKVKNGVTTEIKYTYDASGNRISKAVNGKQTWYVRDASGNVMAIYTRDAEVNGGQLTQTEAHMYGSSRLGVWRLNVQVENAPDNTVYLPGLPTRAITNSFERGNKQFEVTNHLGNVLVTVSDKKIPVSTNGVDVDYYKADVLSANDYYTFGMQMPDRQFSANNSYRYGFNGQEVEKELNPSITSAEFWMYDGRLGRRWNTDPIRLASESPFAVFRNSPIQLNDPAGDCSDCPKVEVEKTPAIQNTQVKGFDWKGNTKKLTSGNWTDGGHWMGSGQEPERKYNSVTTTAMSSIEYKFPTAESINKWNDQLSEGKSRSDLGGSIVGTAIGAALGGTVPGIITGVAAAVLSYNITPNQMQINPGDKIVIETKRETIRSTSYNKEAYNSATEGGNGIRFTTTIKVVSAEGIATNYGSYKSFINLNPLQRENDQQLMKDFETRGGSKTTITNPNWNGILWQLRRTK